MVESGPETSKGYHLAGVVPVSGLSLDFGFPWHDSLQPIAKQYLAVERAVVECAYAGCKTIWVVCNDDIQPLVKHRMGDYIEDPYHLNKVNFVRFPKDHKKQIPIFYTPVHPKDRDRRDSFGWSILHGALSAFIVATKISKWLIPDKYYVAFPYGVYDPSELYKHRSLITDSAAFFLSYEGKTVRDGEYLGFTMNASEYNRYLHDVKGSCTGGSRELHFSDRWSSRHFGLDKIFKTATIEESNIRNLSWYYKIDSWDGLVSYLSSPEGRDIKRPSDTMFKTSKYFKVGRHNNKNE